MLSRLTRKVFNPRLNTSLRNFSSNVDKRVVLAYSGGLDTSTILAWLIDEGYSVIAFLANVGQPGEDPQVLQEKAQRLGAEKTYVVDCRKHFVENYVFPCMRANAVYERRYLLGTSIARPCILEAMVDVAKKENCKYLSHGATGKGNDQVRFELHANYLDPSIQMIAPWRIPEFFNRFEGRQDLLDYAASKGIPVVQTKKKSYSMDENLLHISYESGVLEDPSQTGPEDMWIMTNSPMDAPDEVERIKLTFNQGNPVKAEIGGQTYTDSLDLFLALNEVGGKHGIGRLDLVENRYVGMKSRGCYETPGGTIIMQAHTDLEALVMDREVMKIRDELAVKFAQNVYNGYWFSPEMDYIRSCLDYTQRHVNGEVQMDLYKGNVMMRGRSSPNSLYDANIASMDIAGDYNPADAGGFIRINALRLKTFAMANQNRSKNN